MAKRNLNVTLEGRGALKLGESNYIATGGEGSVYRAHSTVIKVYTDPGKMTRDGMADKVGLLKALNHPTIVAPQGLVFDARGAPIGFYMPWVEGEPLSRVFTNAYRTRTGFSLADEQFLVAGMRETVAHAHTHHALMVDANELNWLVAAATGAAGPQPRVIDVDSWAVGRWPATVIMPSIRDWRNPTFSALTDWFAWAVVTFQVWTGIHPYQGRAAGYKPGELERRMRDNVSVFSPDVHLPASVREFNRIPGGLLAWYRATFLDGARTIPPLTFEAAAAPAAARVLRIVTTTTGQVAYTRLLTLPANVVRIWASGAALLQNGEVFSLSTRPDRLEVGVGPDGEVVKVEGGWLIADRAVRPGFTFSDGLHPTKLPCTLAMRRIFRAYDRLFAVTETELVELRVHALAKPTLTLDKRWSILPNATGWFDNVAVMDVMGHATLLLPQPTAGLVQLRCPELDGLTVLAARAGHRFVALVTLDGSGVYQKIELSLNSDSTAYTLWRGALAQPELNLTILPNGVVATVPADGELAVYVPANGNLRKVQDRGISSAEPLAVWGSKVVVARGRELWQVSLAPGSST